MPSLNILIWLEEMFSIGGGLVATYDEIEKLCQVHNKCYDKVVSILCKIHRIINVPDKKLYMGLKLRDQAKMSLEQMDDDASAPQSSDAQLIHKTSPRRKYIKSIVSQSTRLTDVKILKTKISEHEKEKHELECKVAILETENEEMKYRLDKIEEISEK